MKPGTTSPCQRDGKTNHLLYSRPHRVSVATCKHLIIDRTRTGRVAAKARGVKFGPRPTLTLAQIAHARRLIDQDGYTAKEAAALFGVHRSTLYRAINKTG